MYIFSKQRWQYVGWAVDVHRYHVFIFFVLSYYESLRSEFRVVMSVTISAYKLCSVRLYLQLFVGGLMSYLRYFCVYVSIVVSNTYCVPYLFSCSSSCVLYLASFSGLSFFDCTFRYSLTLICSVSNSDSVVWVEAPLTRLNIEMTI